MRHAIHNAIHNCLRAKDIEQSQDYAVQRFAAAPAVEKNRAHGCGIDKRGGCGQAGIQHFDGGVDGGGVAGPRPLGNYEPEFCRGQVGGLV